MSDPREMLLMADWPVAETLRKELAIVKAMQETGATLDQLELVTWPDGRWEVRRRPPDGSACEEHDLQLRSAGSPLGYMQRRRGL